MRSCSDTDIDARKHTNKSLNGSTELFHEIKTNCVKQGAF